MGAIVIMLGGPIGGGNRDTLTPLDPRSVCNLMLDEAEGKTLLDHISLQKLLYFAHGLHLMETKRPLVAGYFEAWRHGPVHPTAYAAFKKAGARHIDFRAVRQDPLTGASTQIAKPTDFDALRCIETIMGRLSGRPTGYLIELSHAKGAPWDIVVHKARTSMVLGMRIPDNIIRESFQRHKLSVGSAAPSGEASEDAPFT